MKQTLEKFAALKGRWLLPKNTKITLTKEKERKALFGVNAYKNRARYIVRKIYFPDHKDHRIRLT